MVIRWFERCKAKNWIEMNQEMCIERTVIPAKSHSSYHRSKQQKVRNKFSETELLHYIFSHDTEKMVRNEPRPTNKYRINEHFIS